MEGIRTALRFRIAKINESILISKMATMKWVKWRFRIAESFSSSTQDDGHGGILETLQTTSDSELLKAI